MLPAIGERFEILFPVLPFPQLTLSKHLYSRVCRVLKMSNQLKPHLWSYLLYVLLHTCALGHDQLVLQFKRRISLHAVWPHHFSGPDYTYISLHYWLHRNPHKNSATV